VNWGRERANIILLLIPVTKHFSHLIIYYYYSVNDLRWVTLLFCKGCYQVGEGAEWQHVPGVCRVGRDQEIVEVNVTLPCTAVANVDLRHRLVWTNNTFSSFFPSFMLFLLCWPAKFGHKCSFVSFWHIFPAAVLSMWHFCQWILYQKLSLRCFLLCWYALNVVFSLLANNDICIGCTFPLL